MDTAPDNVSSPKPRACRVYVEDIENRLEITLRGFAQNQVWCEIVALACEPLPGQLLALTETACRWEPRRLRLRLFSVAGRLARGGRRPRLRLAEHWPWAGEITAAITRLQVLPSG